MSRAHCSSPPIPSPLVRRPLTAGTAHRLHNLLAKLPRQNANEGRSEHSPTSQGRPSFRHGFAHASTRPARPLRQPCFRREAHSRVDLAQLLSSSRRCPAVRSDWRPTRRQLGLPVTIPARRTRKRGAAGRQRDPDERFWESARADALRLGCPVVRVGRRSGRVGSPASAACMTRVAAADERARG